MNDSDLYGSLTYDDAAAAIDGLCKAFGFTSRLVVPGPDGTIIHSELALGKAVVMVSSPKPDFGRVGQQSLAGSSCSLCLHVDDPDSHFNVARKAGATIVQEVKDEDYGSRGYMARDVEGHLWYFGTYRPGAHWNQP